MPAVPGNPYSIYLLEQNRTFSSFFVWIFYLFCSTYIKLQTWIIIMPHSWYWSFPSSRRFQTITVHKKTMACPPALVLCKERIYISLSNLSFHSEVPLISMTLSHQTSWSKNEASALPLILPPAKLSSPLPNTQCLPRVLKIALIRILVAH